MNYTIFVNTGLLLFSIILLNACAFVPKSVPTISHDKITCNTVTSKLEISIVTFDVSDYHCRDEACAVLFLGIPLVTAVVTLPIVAIGNTINYIEKQIRCDL